MSVCESVRVCKWSLRVLVCLWNVCDWVYQCKCIYVGESVGECVRVESVCMWSMYEGVSVSVECVSVCQCKCVSVYVLV